MWSGTGPNFSNAAKSFEVFLNRCTKIWLNNKVMLFNLNINNVSCMEMLIFNSPGLNKLHELGQQIQLLKPQTQGNWTKLHMINANEAQLPLLYSDFYLGIRLRRCLEKDFLVVQVSQITELSEQSFQAQILCSQ